MVLLWRRGYTTIKYKADINGEDRGGDDSEGDDEGGRVGGGRGYENDGDDGNDDGSNSGGDGGDDDAKRQQTQQSNIKLISTARNVVVTTARATMKAARAATVAGATRMTVTMVTTVATAATMTPNGDKYNEEGICRRQQRRDIICRSKSARKHDRQLISRGGTSRTSFPLCWGGCRSHKPSRYRERRRA
jgi:hypothetical protein